MSRRRAAALAACALLVVLALPARAGAPFDFARTPGVLPKDIVPVEYVLHLVPHVAEGRFEGRMTVRIDVRRPTAAIVMHALDLEIASARLERPGRAPLTLAAPQLDAERQTATFRLPSPLARGRHVLALRWRGKINVAAEGLYIDRFRGADGEERVLLATDLEPTGARRILPCWDEPAFRARFRVSVDLPAGREEAYSNMPVARREVRAGGARRIAFLATPKMASYLLALVVGDLERSSTRVDGVEIGIVATPRQERRRRLRAGRQRRADALVQRLFRRALPPAQARSPGDRRAASAAAWRTGARSSTTRRPCWSIPKPAPRRRASAPSASSATRWRTSGSATW